MNFNITGFPVCKQVQNFRIQLHNEAYSDANSRSTQLASWLGHKVVTMASLPLHAVECILSTAVGSATTLAFGSLNMLVFAASVGHIKPEVPTGFCFFGEGAVHGAWGVIRNLGELVYDAGNILYQGYRAARWTTHKLGLTEAFRTMMQAACKIINFCCGRIEKGYKKASRIEPEANSGRLPVVDEFNQKMQDLRQFDDSRPLKTIFSHYLGSVIAVPLNGAVAIGTGVIGLASLAAFVAKVALYALTNISIPLPTGCFVAGAMAFNATWNVLADLSFDGIDVFILTYKTAKLLHITDLVVGMLKLFTYIPRAYFGIG